MPLEDYVAKREDSKYCILILDKKGMKDGGIKEEDSTLLGTNDIADARRLHAKSLNDFFLKEPERYRIYIFKKQPDGKYASISKKELT